MMSNNKSSEEIKEEIRILQKAKESVLKQINKVEEQLKLVSELSGDLPWVSFKKVYSVKELAGKHKTLKEALSEDLKNLKEQLRKISLEGNKKNVAYSKVQAQEKSEQLRRRIAEELKKGEKTGTLTDQTLKDILNESEEVLKAYLSVLESEPNEENITNVVKEIEIQHYFGAEENCPNCVQAWEKLKKASKTLWEKANWNFRRNPTSANFKKLIQSLSLNQQLGGDLKQFQPDGWQSVKTNYKVKKGDSLSSISNSFYKKTSYWDIIYIENFSKIGNNPDNLKEGVELMIP